MYVMSYVLYKLCYMYTCGRLMLVSSLNNETDNKKKKIPLTRLIRTTNLSCVRYYKNNTYICSSGSAHLLCQKIPFPSSLLQAECLSSSVCFVNRSCIIMVPRVGKRSNFQAYTTPLYIIKSYLILQKRLPIFTVARDSHSHSNTSTYFCGEPKPSTSMKTFFYIGFFFVDVPHPSFYSA